MTEKERKYLKWYYRTEDGEYASATSFIYHEFIYTYRCINNHDLEKEHCSTAQLSHVTYS